MKTKIILLLVSIFLMPLFASASIDKNLYYGLQNDSQVEELQDFLIDQGYLTGEATGNYFSLTLSAVKKFQTANNLPSTGYFGKLSRQKVNDILSNNLQSSNQQSITEEEKSSSNISNTTSNNASRESLIALLQKLLNNQTQNNQQVQQQIQEQPQSQGQSQQQSSITPVVESSNDVCVNIEGIQTVVPGGMIASGNVCIVSNVENKTLSTPSYTQPLTAIMTYHPNLPNNQTLYMQSLYINDCQGGAPLSCKGSSENERVSIDGLTLNFQDTIEPLNDENYLQHGYKKGEIVIVKSFSTSITGLDIDSDLSDIKFLIGGKEISTIRSGNNFIFNGSVELTGNDLGIYIWSKINKTAIGKNLQVSFNSLELIGKTTNLPIAIPFSLPQSGRNFTIHR